LGENVLGDVTCKNKKTKDTAAFFLPSSCLLEIVTYKEICFFVSRTIMAANNINDTNPSVDDICARLSRENIGANNEVDLTKLLQQISELANKDVCFRQDLISMARSLNDDLIDD
jgi:hypothetical protein